MRVPVYATCWGNRRGIAHVAKETRPIRQEAVWLGEVEAPDEQAAMEKAAAELRVLANRLMAIRR
jgi:hypothetical protein